MTALRALGLTCSTHFKVFCQLIADVGLGRYFLQYCLLERRKLPNFIEICRYLLDQVEENCCQICMHNCIYIDRLGQISPE